LAQPGVAAEKENCTDDVDGDEGEGDRHPDEEEHGRAAEQQERGELPRHIGFPVATTPTPRRRAAAARLVRGDACGTGTRPRAARRRAASAPAATIPAGSAS